MKRRNFVLAGAVLTASLPGGSLISAQAQTPETISPGPADALIVIDMQNDFLPGGSLAVAEGDKIIGPIGEIARQFQNVVLTQDWHPADHISFASQHGGRKPFDVINLPYGAQVLWPDHCVQGTRGAKFADGIDSGLAQLIIRKGYHRSVDSYSAFLEADRKTQTGLAGYLKDRGITNVYLCGLATDFCVAWSALDGRAFGFNVWVIEDATKGIDLNGSLAAAWEKMTKAGVRRIRSTDILRP